MNSTLIENLFAYASFSSQELHRLPEVEEIKGRFALFLDQLESKALRVAQKDEEGKWCVNTKIKQIILLGFRLGKLVSMGDSALSFVDKDTFPLRQFDPSDQIRLVPGGVSVRRGAYIAPSVIMMPPSYVNVGACVEEGCLLDSNTLVGSCAQIGKRVHLSAGVQIGGVLEPVGQLPVIIEDDVFVGGNCGIYEGTQVQEGAVIGAGVVLTRSCRVYDLVYDRMLSSSRDTPLQIPPQAVVVAGTRRLEGDFAQKHGLALYAPIIIKYRDMSTDAKTALEESLR